ncbi:hypothetical protein [Flavobacterium tegetincola]|uniref:hypothetical protein n=1 Tax=Flavobacterium tegetincola TaxID=150172 RepID=UPI00042A92C4|nr:hypothetical protein [Flavobacterium tegetincola]
MKTKILLFLTILSLVSCSSDDSSNDPASRLPPETQTGANTFGCIIDGKILLPRSGNTSQINPLYGARLLRGFAEFDFDYYELEIIDHKSNRSASFYIHMHNAVQNGVGSYIIDESNGMNGIDGYAHNYIHCNVYSRETSSYQKYVSFENSGSFIITKSMRNATTGNIISGTFNCKVRNINNPNDEIEITDGRFDINSLTIKTTYFP